MAKTNKKNDSDNDKQDILRAEDIIPHPNGNEKQSHLPSQEAKHQIPRFDLAEEIMAEHRKIASIKRKSPEQKVEPLRPIDKSKGHTEALNSPISETIEEKQAIRDIVARDIEKLCRGESLDISLATDFTLLRPSGSEGQAD
jgi:hypothetical protein